MTLLQNKQEWKVLDLTKISSTASIELKVKFNVEDISIGLEVLCILQTLMIVDQKCDRGIKAFKIFFL